MTINTVDVNYTALNIQESSLTQGVGTVGVGASGGSATVQQTGSVPGDSAQISGPGQLFSQLQQLQQQDPTKFQQLVSTIANQLQSASQQSTGIQANFLSELASKFQTAATTGNLTALQPSHHGHHAHGTYNAQGQTTPTATLPGVSPTSDTSGTSSSGLNIGQLFANIAKEVSQAVGA